MKREQIKEIIEGITKEQLDRIMEINGNDIESAKGNLTTLQQQVTDLKAQLDDRDKQLKDLKDEVKDNEKLQSRITELEQKNANDKADYDKKLKALERDHEIEGKLHTAKAKNLKAVKALLDMDSKTDIDEQIKALQEGEETAFLFETAGKPPKGTTPSSGGQDPAQKHDPASLSDAVSKALKLKG